ncbi:MAG: glycosyltransferase, partial [Chloroflexi bacterium]|nr:glycosyltransferase [Chloroflexota bacterium]
MKLSVMMITYNHERFVAQALESALSQQTDFAYEIVVGEDCSADRTREIVAALAGGRPGQVRLMARQRNLGIAPNFVQTIRDCRGEYVAVLEGDDYWTSPHKLQRQVDFLEAHPECAACFHRARVIYEDGRPGFTFPPPDQPAFSALEDLLAGNFMPSCSVVFRRALVGELPPGFERLPMGDWPLHLLNARFGKLGFLDETMGVYRVHPGGAWTPTGPARRLESEIAVLEAIGPYLPLRAGEALRAALARRREKLALAGRPPAADARPLRPRRPGERYRVAFYAPEMALPAGPDSPTSAEASALACLAAALAARGNDVMVYAGDQPARAGGSRTRPAAEAARAECDVLICTAPAIPQGIRAGLRLLWTRVPVTAGEAAQFDYLYAVSAALANQLRHTPGIQSLKLFTAYDGCPPAPGDPANRDLFRVQYLCRTPADVEQAACIAADLRAHDPRFRLETTATHPPSSIR